MTIIFSYISEMILNKLLNWCLKKSFHGLVTVEMIMGQHDLFLWLGKVDTAEISWHWAIDLATCKADDTLNYYHTTG